MDNGKTTSPTAVVRMFMIGRILDEAVGMLDDVMGRIEAGKRAYRYHPNLTDFTSSDSATKCPHCSGTTQTGTRGGCGQCGKVKW